MMTDMTPASGKADSGAEVSVPKWWLEKIVVTQWLPDHACAQCVPNGELVVKGWQCMLHHALSLLATAAANGPGEADKPYAIEAGFSNFDGTWSVMIKRLPLGLADHEARIADVQWPSKLLWLTPSTQQPGMVTVPREAVVELSLCEIDRLILKPDVTYRFLNTPGCTACAEYAAPYIDAALRSGGRET